MYYRVRIWKHFLNRFYAEIGTDDFLVEIEIDPKTREVTNTRAYCHNRAAGQDFFNDSTLINQTTVNYYREGYPTHVWEAIAYKAVKQLYGENPTIPKKNPALKTPPMNRMIPY
jgi:hypothetical protein